MKPLLIAGLFLSFSLLLPLESFASDSAVNQSANATPANVITCMECIKVNVSVWQFKPSGLKAQLDALTSLYKLQLSPVFHGPGSAGGPTVIAPGAGHTFIDTIEHLGSLQQRLEWTGASLSDHPLPLAISSFAGDYSAVLTFEDRTRQLFRPQPFTGLVRFSLHADAPANGGIESQGSEGQVWIPQGNEILNIQPVTDGSYIIWLIQVSHF
ncbi:hypothetical protein C7431_11026 [Pantoea allii]|uniref:Uncharacterized protein n=1 Tax=Pantoea allii TaxID=574096 RepID=A0A2V2BDE1_9GAMM|nr:MULTISPECIES: hypothetical protein [Pantoea]OWY74709.1 hypothetical protein CDN97_22095 [Pantoea sp. AMG 501]PWK94532.1 hypothetical protein C7431_11026 [Pantoea allii]